MQAWNLSMDLFPTLRESPSKRIEKGHKDREKKESKIGKLMKF